MSENKETEIILPVTEPVSVATLQILNQHSNTAFPVSGDTK